MLTLFLTLIAAAFLAIYITRDKPDGYGVAGADPGHLSQWVVGQLQMLESDLRKINRTKRPVGWYDIERQKFTPSIRPDWQLRAKNSTPIAFELLLIEVWQTQGEQYGKHRLSISPYKSELQARFKFSLIQKKESPCLAAY